MKGVGSSPEVPMESACCDTRLHEWATQRAAFGSKPPCWRCRTAMWGTRSTRSGRSCGACRRTRRYAVQISGVVARRVAQRVASSRRGAGGFRLRDSRCNPNAQGVPPGQSGDADPTGAWPPRIGGLSLTAGLSHRHARPSPKWSTSLATPSRSTSGRRSTVYAARVRGRAPRPSGRAHALTVPHPSRTGPRPDPNHAIPPL